MKNLVNNPVNNAIIATLPVNNETPVNQEEKVFLQVIEVNEKTEQTTKKGGRPRMTEEEKAANKEKKRLAKEEAERIAKEEAQKEEENRLAELQAQKEEAERIAKEKEANRIAYEEEQKLKLQDEEARKTANKGRKDAILDIKSADKEAKTLSGCLKFICANWKTKVENGEVKMGYEKGFAFLGLKLKDMTVPKMHELWSKSLFDERGFLYSGKQRKYTVINNKRVYETYKDEKTGKDKFVMETVKRPFLNNFTPIRIFEAILEAHIEKGIIKL